MSNPEFLAPRSQALAVDAVRVLVVVPTLNEAAHIEAVLGALLADARGAATASMTIAVVDGGSTDETRAIVERVMESEPSVELLHNPARIQSAAVNLAVRRLGHAHDVLIRCDAHAEYPDAYCSRLVQTLLRTEAHAVVVPMDSIGERGLQRALAWLSNSPLGTGGSAHRAGTKSGFVDHGHHAAFRLDFFGKVGGYDECFTHNEDAELDCRQRALGAKIYLDCEVRMLYRPRATLGSLFNQYFKYGVGRSRTVRRHPSSLRLRQLAVPAHLALTVFAIAVSPYTPLFLCWPALYLAIVIGFSLRLAFRHRSLTGLLVAPAALTMHTAWASGFFSGLFSHRERVWQRDTTLPLVLAAGDRQ